MKKIFFLMVMSVTLNFAAKAQKIAMVQNSLTCDVNVYEYCLDPLIYDDCNDWLSVSGSLIGSFPAGTSTLATSNCAPGELASYFVNIPYACGSPAPYSLMPVTDVVNNSVFTPNCTMPQTTIFSSTCSTCGISSATTVTWNSSFNSIDIF